MIEELAAKQAITELHYKYAQAIDKKEWATLRSIAADRVYGDFSKWGMGTAGELPADALVGMVQGLFSKEGLVTQHYMTNFLIEVDGEMAHGEVYVFARHKLGDEVMNLNAYYICDYVKTDDGWKISSIDMVPRWDEGGEVIRFFDLPDANPNEKTYLFVTATPILGQHDALERYVGGVIPLLMQAGGSKPKIIKQDKSIVGHTETFMSMIVEFETEAAGKAARAVFESEAYAALVPDRERAFSKMNIAFYSDMPQS